MDHTFSRKVYKKPPYYRNFPDVVEERFADLRV